METSSAGKILSVNIGKKLGCKKDPVLHLLPLGTKLKIG